MTNEERWDAFISELRAHRRASFMPSKTYLIEKSGGIFQTQDEGWITAGG